MFNLNALVQKAQSFIDPTLSPVSKTADRNLSKAALFRHQFRLPDSESPIYEITAELSLPAHHSSNGTTTDSAGKGSDRAPGNIYTGKLHLSDNYLCFSTQATSFLPGTSVQVSSAFTGQTHGSGPAGNGFTLPLCAVRKVERLHTQNSLFALAITTWNGLTTVTSEKVSLIVPQRFTLQLAGSRQACERFCDGLKKGLRHGVKQVESLKTVVAECFSEYLLSGYTSRVKDEDKKMDIQREPPDAGLGMLFRYPGDPKKLRDRSKMRLWAEYLRGQLFSGAHSCNN